jgi:hypothetical protein
MQKIEIDMSREWLIMLEDYCVKAESGQDIPPEDVHAMGEFLKDISERLRRAEPEKRRA